MNSGAFASRALTTLDRLFAPGVATILSFAGSDAPEILPEERTYAERLASSRRDEFRHGRACARLALARLGRKPGPIPAGERREPSWPPGIVGSISHAGSAAAAVVGLSSTFCGLGVDLESAVDLEPALWPRVCRPEELQRLAWPAEDPGRATKLLFSAKECAYKALWPRLRVFLDFHDLEILMDPKMGHFSVRSHCPACPAALAARLEGRFMSLGDWVATGVTLDRE